MIIDTEPNRAIPDGGHENKMTDDDSDVPWMYPLLKILRTSGIKD